MRIGDTRRGQIGPLLLVVLAALLSVGGFYVISWFTEPPALEGSTDPVPVITVELQAAERRSFPVQLALTGTVEAKERIPVGSEVSGLRIVELAVEEGDMVQRGQLLVRLNSDLLQARRQQLLARLDQQRAALQKARQPERPLEIAQLRSALQQALAQVDQQQAELAIAEAAFRDSERNFQRFESLFAQGAVPRSEFDLRELEIARARGQLEASQTRVSSLEFAARAARERLTQAEEGGRTEDVAIADAQLAELQAQLSEMDAQLAQTEVRAPVDGWVLQRQAQLGDIAAVGSPLFVLAQGGQLELRGQVPETLVGSIEVGQAVRVRRDQELFEGTVYRVSPLVDTATRNAEVRIDLPSGRGLLPGMFAEGTVEIEERETVSVPTEAVLGQAPNEYVFIYSQGKAVQRPVTVGQRNGEAVSVLSGLEVGEPVIVRGGGFLRDGDPVEPS